MNFLQALMPEKRLLTHPWEVVKSRDGKPFAQSLARNLGHMTHGKAIYDTVDQKILGDTPPAGPQATMTGLLSSGTSGAAGTGVTAMAPKTGMEAGQMLSTVPTGNQTPGQMSTLAPITQGKPKQDLLHGGLMDIMQAILQKQQGGM